MGSIGRRSVVENLSVSSARALLVGILGAGYILSFLAIDAFHDGLGLVRGEGSVDPTSVLAAAAAYTAPTLVLALVPSLILAALEEGRGRIFPLWTQVLLVFAFYLALGAALGETSADSIWLRVSGALSAIFVVGLTCIEQFRMAVAPWIRRAAARSFCIGAALVVIIGLVMWLRIAPNAVRDLKQFGGLGGAAFVFDIDMTPIVTGDGRTGILLAMAGPSAVVLRPSCSTATAEAEIERITSDQVSELPPGQQVC